MNPILQNFMSVLKRFKTATILNILGLSVAFAAFLIIMMQIDYDKTFDTHHKNANDIYRFDLHMGNVTQAVISRPMTRLVVQSSPHVKASVIMHPFEGSIVLELDKNGHKVLFRERSIGASEGLMKVFHFDMVEGTDKAFDDPETILIPESIAKKIFGKESALGKMIKRSGSSSVRVGGVYKDFAKNSSLANVVYSKIGAQENYNSWSNWNYTFFMLLDGPDAKDNLIENLIENIKKDDNLKNVFGSDIQKNISSSNLILTSLPDLHFTKGALFDTLPKASKQTLMILMAIAFIIILIAGINFTNFSTALTPMRIKSINTQKVLGSSVSSLRASLIIEAICISTFAFVVSLFIINIVKHTEFASMVDPTLSFDQHPHVYIATGLIAVMVGLLAGIYPAFYMTSFAPALVLKGSFGLSPKGRQMRNILVGIQFTASFALIIGAIFMYLQNNYMQNSSFGYDKDAVIISDMNENIIKNKDALRNTIKGFSDVEDVVFANSILSSGDSYMSWGRNILRKDSIGDDNSINFFCIPVSPDFIKVMGIKIKDGRDFREDDELKANISYIFNQTAIDRHNLTLEDKIGDGDIVGFIPDIKLTSFRMQASPMAFIVEGTDQGGNNMAYQNAYIKVKTGGNLKSAMRQTREAFAKFDSEYPFNIRFYDEVLQRTYEKELKIGLLISLFSLVAIFISIVGVFGLVVFESEYRRKEIAIRKVIGSSTANILMMFNKKYVVIMSICFAIGAPTAWYSITQWLNNFAYRTPMFWWVLPLAFLIITIITISTVTFQNWSVANANPVKNVKSE